MLWQRDRDRLKRAALVLLAAYCLSVYTDSIFFGFTALFLLGLIEKWIDK
jgi:hypothetical protein